MLLPAVLQVLVTSSVCYLAVLLWGKSHMDNSVSGFLLLSTAFLSEILSALTVHQHSMLGTEHSVG